MKKLINISDKRLLSTEIQDKVFLAEKYILDEFHIDTQKKSKLEVEKKPYRNEVINFLLSKLNRETIYLEIGVRDLDANFNKIKATKKYSVDPGLEVAINLADFALTSDDFFHQLSEGVILDKNILFDVIFIDGLHLADQVDRDIKNALKFLKDDGFIVMHDCNPPTEFHASENYYYRLSPAAGLWNGTTWKPFFKLRKRTDLYSCCIDSDWGIGVVSKTINFGMPSTVINEFYEYNIFDKNRNTSLNLIDFESFKNFF